MQNQLFVGNLAFSTTKEELEAAFSPHGTILEVKIPIDRDTGRVRGFAFVTFETQQQAEKALAALDGSDLNGRPIRVNVAEAKKEGGGRGGRTGGSGGGGGRSGGGSGGRSSGGAGGSRGGRSSSGGGGNREGGWW